MKIIRVELIETKDADIRIHSLIEVLARILEV